MHACRSTLEDPTYTSPLGKLWVFHRPGHTDGSIDLVIDTKGDVTNRFVVRGSQASAPCAPLPGQREIIDAHGNAELFSIEPTLSDVGPLGGTSLGGTPITVTGANFAAAGAGTHKVLFGGTPATNVVVTGDTSLTCQTPTGPPGELVEVAVVNNNGKAIYAGTYFYNPLPTLTSILPTSGDWRGGTTVQVRGSGYLLTSGVNDVFFGGVKATNVSVKSDSLLTCRAPAGTPGRTVQVLVRNPNGEAKVDNIYRFSSDVTITSVDPAHASALGGTIVLLSGTSFTGSGATPTVTFGGVATGLVTLLSDNTVLAVVPPGAPGALVDIVLTNSVGSATFTGFRYHAFPRLTSLAPISGRDQGGTTVTLNGTGFLVDDAGTNNVRFGGTPAQQVTVLSDGSLRCLTPPGTRGTSVNVTISNQNGTAVLPLAYTYSGPLEVSGILPGAGSSLGGTLVTLTGNGFVDGPAGTNTVRFGGIAATQIVAISDSTLTCRTPAGTPLAVVDVELTNNNGTLTLPGAFRYYAKPTLATIAPNHGSAGTTTPVAITGTGFLNDQAGVNVITVGGAAATGVQVLNDTSLVCNFPPGNAGATVNVVLTNQNGSSTLTGGFRYHTPPTLTGIAPADGGASQQQRITLTGTGFQLDSAGTPTITFGGLVASAVSVTNDTSLRCNAPVGPAGQTVDIVLTNARGSATLPRAYRFHARPTLTQVSPSAGTSQGGATVTLTGSGFLVDGAGVNVVNFGGSFASNVVVVSDTTLRCSSPPGVQDAVVDVVVSNTNGTATLPGGYSYSISPPVVIAVSPANGPAQNPGSVQLTGSGFLTGGAGTNTVRFGSATSGIVAVIDNTRLSCQVPPGTPGTTVDVVVSNVNGTGQLARAFRYNALPVLTAISPTTGGSAGGTAMQLTGSGFKFDSPGTNAVTFGGIPAQNVTVVNDTTISCTVPAGTSGTTVDVRVTNANGQTGTRPFSYYQRPTLVGAMPGSGSPQGGTRVSLHGTGFVNNDAGLNAVRFGQRAAANVVVVSDTELTCISPRGDAGSVEVTVSNANGWATLVDGFFYGKLSPTITEIDPPSGPARGANTVTLKGRGFSGGVNSVMFGSVLATGVVTLDDGTVQCTCPSGKYGTAVDVELVNINGASTLTSGYRYHMPPTLDGLSPTQGKALVETRVTLTGTGFAKEYAGQTEVLFGGVRARDVVVLDDSHVVCKAMGGGPGAVLDVTVRNCNGSATLPDAFRVTGGPPSIESMTPSAGPFIGGTRVDFVGRGFAAAPVRVMFGTKEALQVVASGDTLLSCVTPPGTLGQRVTVMVTTKNGNCALVGAFLYEGIQPVLTGIVPNHGSAAGGLRVTLTGSSFTALGAKTTRVTFSGVPATDVILQSDTLVTCTVPPGAAGTTNDVVLMNENGRDTLAQAFRYHSAPAVSSITPPVGRPEGGTLVALTGSGFTVDGAGTNLVFFGDVPASNVSVVSNTILACTTPPAALGSTVSVTVTNLNGSGSLTDGFSYRFPVQISSVTPPNGPTAGGTLLTITGSGFQDNGAGIDRVTVKGAAALDVVTVSDTTITCRTAPVVNGGPADVVVTNDNGSATAAAAFRYIAPPSLTALAPDHGPAAGGTRVTLTGRGFLEPGAGVSQVLFGGAAASGVTVVSDTTITCTTPPGTSGARADVRITNGNGANTLTGGFRYHDSPALTLLTPNHGPRGGSTLTLTGQGFLVDAAGTNTVAFGGAPATQVVVLDDSTLSCRAPAGAAGATVDVSVSNANGSTTLASGYRYHREPTLTAVAPARGPAAGGTTLTLTGTGFQVDSPGTTQVILGGLAASSVVVLNDTTLTCATPAGSPDQTANVTIANANGQATLVNGFRYNAAPTLTALLPVAGSTLGGTTVTLTGTGFSLGSPGPSTVRFGGVPATGVNVLSDTSLTCVTPPGTLGASVDVSVTNLSGAATLVAAYRYTTAPTLASLAPDHGTALGGTDVTLTGTGFTDAAAGVTQVSFGGVAATAVTVLDDQHVRCTAPTGTGGALADVVVTNGNGAANLAAAFRYHDLPRIQGVLPTHGSSTASTSVTLAGAGFLVDGAGSNAVRFGSIAALNVVVVDDGTLTCDVGPQTPGSVVDVRVSNLNGVGIKTAGFSFDASSAPTITSVSLADGPAAGGGIVTITGTGFQANGAGTNAVTFAGIAAASVSVLGDTSLSCKVPAGTAGTQADVRVTNANGSALLPAGYRYHGLPTITSVSPSGGPSGGGTLVTIRGTGFLNDAAGTVVVRFADRLANSVGVFDDGRLTCRAPAGPAGTSVTITLTTANGEIQLANGFRYNPKPSLSAVTPADGPASGGNRVTITGTGFLSNGASQNAVTFAGIAATNVVVQTDRQIDCTVPPGTGGLTVSVGVTNVNGSTSLPNAYRYHARPTLSNLSPKNGPLAGGTTITLAGTGFQVDSPGTNRVTVGGRPATNVAVQSDIRLTFVTPAGAAPATVDVVLSNDNGASSLLNAFSYDSIPIVAATMPNKGTTQGSTSVTVMGSNFSPDTTVSFGSQAALGIVVVDDSHIACLTPPSTDRAWVDVKVSSSMGEAMLPQGYQYIAPPTLTAVEPASGTPLGGTMVVLSGTGFLDDGAGENRVTFAGRPATSVSVLDDQHLSCEVPGGPALTNADVELTNDNGTVLLPRAYRWQMLLATDLNSDGRGDLILTSPGDDRAAPDAGAVRVFFGSSLPAADRRSSGADLLILPERVATSFGMPVASGDLDGDGDAELLIGAPLDDSVVSDAGAVYVFEGPHSASASALTILDASTERLGTFDGQRFGTALALRDVNRDGMLDLLVGATGGTGAVHLFLGGASGLAPQAAVVVTGATAGDRFGYGIATGDLNGDGWAELLVGAPNSLGSGTGPTARPGAVRVFRGGPSLYASTPWLVFSGLQDGESFGSDLVAADFTGDGFEDLVASAPWASRSGAQSGAAFLFAGGTALASKDENGARAILAAEGPGDLFGYALAAGDVNGDGLFDVLAGAPRQSTSGRAYLFFGKPTFADRGAADADVLLQAEPGTQGEFGRKVALIDVDGNGLTDMVVTAPRYDSTGSDVGRVYVFRASPNPSRQGDNDDATMTGSSAGEELGRSTTGDH